jgi:hypothetical protein
MRTLAILLSTLALGCGGPGGSGTRSAGEIFDTPNGEAECVKIEHGDLKLGASFTLGGVTVTITDLQTKGDSDGELIGFTVSGSGVSYLVKAGGDGYYGTSPSWVNPNGTSGSKAHAISHVTICVGDTSDGIPDPSVGGGSCTNCPGSGGSGGSGQTDDCTNPDGCPGSDSDADSSTGGAGGSGSDSSGTTGDPPIG